MSELGEESQFGAKTCGIHWIGDRTWLECASTALITLVYVQAVDVASQHGTGPTYQWLGDGDEGVGLFFFLQKRPKFHFSHKKPLKNFVKNLKQHFISVYNHWAVSVRIHYTEEINMKNNTPGRFERTNNGSLADQTSHQTVNNLLSKLDS